MKKFLALLLTAVLLCSMTAASAAGFDGLLPKKSGAGAPVPDPSEINGVYGQLLQASYQFADNYLCDAYVYPTPDNTRDFMDMYTVQCRQAGYSVTAAVISGENGYTIQDGTGLYACIFPDMDGQMLLLIQSGMSFKLASRTNYATVVYNNRAYEMTCWKAEEWAFFDCWQLHFSCDRGVFDYLTVCIPQSARTGDSYRVSGSGHVEGFALFLDIEKELLDINEPLFGYRSDGIDSSSDYASLSVTRIEDVDGGVLIEGVFNGSFNRGSIVIEDFVFSAIVEK